MLRDALRYPRNDRDEAFTTIGLGAVLTAFSFLVIPQIVLLGYFVRVLRETANGSDIPPIFDEWRELLVDGTKAYVIWLGWTLIPLIVQFGLVGGQLEPAQATLWLGGWMLGATSITLLQLGTGAPGFLEWYGSWEPYVVLFITLYIFPAALANFAETGRVRSGFFEGGVKRFIDWAIGLVGRIVPPAANLLELLSNRFISDGEFAPVSTLRSRRYLAVWGGYVLLFMAGEVILRFVSYLPESIPPSVVLLYILIALPVYFYLRTASWSVIGRAWTDVPSIISESSLQYNEDDSYSREDSKNTRTVLRHLRLDGLSPAIVILGGMLTAVNFLGLPAVIISGYLVRVLSTPMEEDRLPPLSGLRELLANGIKMHLIWLGYISIPATILVLSPVSDFGTNFTLFITGFGLPGGLFTAMLLITAGIIGGFLLTCFILVVEVLSLLLPVPDLAIIPFILPLPVGLIMLVVSLYVIPAAILNFSNTNSLRSGFALQSIMRIVLSAGYAIRWSATILLTTSGWTVMFGSYLLMIRLGGSSSVEPIAGLEHLPFFISPNNELLLVLGTYIVASMLYFVLFVISCRILGSVGRI